MRTLLRRRTPWIRGLALAGIGLLAALAPADTITLQNNRTLTGIIEPASTDDRNVSLRTANGTVLIPWAKIVKIETDSGLSLTEARGDQARIDGKLDEALSLYRLALRDHTAPAALQQKIEQVTQAIETRDEKIHGAAFERIGQMLDAEHFQPALDEATVARDAAHEPSARERFGRLAAQAHIGIARQALDRVDYQQAEKHYRQAMDAAPELPHAPLELARMLEQTPSRRLEAIPLLEAGLERARQFASDPTTPSLTLTEYSLARLYLEQQDYPRAATLLTRVALAPDAPADGRALEDAIQALTRQTGQPDELSLAPILTQLDALLERAPGNRRALLLRGRLAFELKRWAEARDALQAALTIPADQPSSAVEEEALRRLAQAQSQLGDRPGAIKTLQALLALQPADYDALCSLGEVRLDESAFEQAHEIFNRAIAADRDKYRAWMGLGRALVGQARYAQARSAFGAVVERHPGALDARLAIARAFYDEDLYQETIEAANGTAGVAAAARTPDAPRWQAEALTLAGDALMKMDRINTARDAYQRALEVRPGDGAAMHGMGQTYQADGRLDQATDWFQRAIAAAPQVPDFHLSLGLHYHQFLGLADKAVPEYDAYLRLGGRDPKVPQWIIECGGTPPEGL